MLIGAKIAAIEFVADEVRVSVVKTGGRLPVLLEAHSATAVYEAPEERFEAMVAAVDRVLAEVATRPAAFIFVASSEYCVARGLTIPFRGSRKVAGAVRFELEPYLAFPIEDLMVDFNVITEVEGETEVLAVGLRRSSVESQLAILAAAGVVPDAVSVDAIALTSLWMAASGRPKGLHAILHLRNDSALLAVTYNKTLALFRRLPITPAQWGESPAPLAREVQNTLRAFQAKWRGEGAIETLHVTGADLSPHERDVLSQAIHLPIQDMVLVSRLSGGSHSLDKGQLGAKYNHYEAGIGAAIGAGGVGLSIDFTRSEQTWEQSLRAMIPHLMFSSCLALLLLLGWAFFYYQGASRLEADAAALQTEIDRINQSISDMAAKGLGEDVDVTPYADPPLIDLIGEIGRLMPENLATLDEVRIAPPGALGAWLTIQGSTPSAANFNEVMGKLEQSLLFTIDGEPEKRVEEGGIIRFTIKARRHETPQETPDANA